METHSFSVLSYLRKGKLDKLGKGSIFLGITVNGLRTELSIKRKIKPEKMVFVKGRVKSSNPKAKALNHYMDKLESKAYAIHYKVVIKKKPFNAELIITAIEQRRLD